MQHHIAGTAQHSTTQHSTAQHSMVSLAHNIDMNRSIDICNINSFNSDQSRSDTTSTRMDTRIEMNREGSLDNNNEDMASKDDKAMVPLHKDFQPGDDDVICGRGKK